MNACVRGQQQTVSGNLFGASQKKTSCPDWSSRGSGKTTPLSRSLSGRYGRPYLTWAVPGKGVYLKNNRTGETIQIGRYRSESCSGTEKSNASLFWSRFDEKGTSFFTFLSEFNF